MIMSMKIPKNVFAKAQEKFLAGDDFNNIVLEPGRYIGQIVEAKTQMVNEVPNVIIELNHVGDIEEDQKGKIAIFFQLSEDRAVWLFRVLDTLGYDVSDLDGDKVESILADLKQNRPVVRFLAKKGGEYINYRIEKILTGDDANVPGVEGTAESEPEPIPTPKPNPVAAKTETKPKANPVAAKSTSKPVPAPVPVAEEEVVEEVPEEVVEETVAITVGLKVKAKLASGDQNGVITAIDEVAQKVTIRADDKKLYKVGLDKISI